jgi:hypothetical protein
MLGPETTTYVIEPPIAAGHRNSQTRTEMAAVTASFTVVRVGLVIGRPVVRRGLASRGLSRGGRVAARLDD